MSKTLEEWKDIPGYNGKYQVSDWGRVRDTNYRGTGTIRMRKILTNNGGYEYIRIDFNGCKQFYFIHRLVWLTFVGNIPTDKQVNHIDENTHNNHLDNLTLLTPKENSNWGTRRKRLSDSKLLFHPRAIVVDKIDKTTGEVLETYPSAMRAEKDGFDRHHIISCCNGGYFSKSNGKWINIKYHKGFIWRSHP